MMAGNTILFNDPYCIIENSTGFRIKSKFEPSFGAASTLFRFRVDFPVAESNLADSKPAITESNLQTPNLQLLRIRSHYGTPALAMLQPLAYHILPESQPYQIASEQLYLAPIQTQASANLVLKGSRHGYHTLRQRGDLYHR